MADLPVFVDMALVLAVFALPFIALVRVLAGSDDHGFDALFSLTPPLGWPHGVQEEDPLPWRFGPAEG
ncbi:MAG: hypothetical protein ACM3JP_02285 [Betaproteobacteria bacterium]